MEKEVQILILGVCLSCMCYVMGELGFCCDFECPEASFKKRVYAQSDG